MTLPRTFAIGDVQGCYDSLQRLLEHIDFNPSHDTLWFTGDLVNRGPQSLATLRFIKNLGNRHPIVLGNHDLHLLALAHGVTIYQSDEDTLQAVLTADDREELITWLIEQPLLYHDHDLGFTMVHAGLAASWDLSEAQRLADEVHAVLRSDAATEFFKHMYGNHPTLWKPTLSGWDRLRCITNYFTRVRFCQLDGSLELKNKGKTTADGDTLVPWFQVPKRANAQLKILFGHWAALGGITHTPNTYALDTGCVWGVCLTAMQLENEQRFSVSCK